ncbi:OmpA family protein [candidate division GN15 bacterium]|nr:OmpA family protein [candidate division GN15 bacterium]
MSDGEQPIIIKKVKKHQHGHHGGSWKVAFADFMTAMMAFFLVMWLVGQSEQVKRNVSEYFRDPGKYQTKGSSGVLKGSSSVLKRDGSSANTLIKEVIKKEHLPTSEERKRMASAAQSILGELEKQPAFKRLKKNVKLQMTSEGLRIILNESEDAPAFFEPGSSKLLQKSAVILMTIAEELGKIENSLVIEGHTDRSYTGDAAYSNWELSTDRANSARQLMEVSGLRDAQVREVRGYADKIPMIAHEPKDPRNRRVSILVLYQSRERAYDQMEVGSDLMAEIE